MSQTPIAGVSSDCRAPIWQMAMIATIPCTFSRLADLSQPKIAVRCPNTEELEILAAQARSLNLCARTIQDAGRTQVAAGSKTILGIGP